MNLSSRKILFLRFKKFLIMKRLIVAVFASYLLVSCGAVYTGTGGNSGGYGSSGNATSNSTADPNTASPETISEYNELIKTYKQDTQQLLSVLLNDDTNSSKTAITVENASPCNMVLTIKSAGFLTKIPIKAGETKGAVLNKDTYRLTAQVCRANYDEIKYITSAYTIKLKN